MDRIKNANLLTFHVDIFKLLSFWEGFIYDTMPYMPMKMGEGPLIINFGWKKITELHILNNCVLLSVRMVFYLWFG